MNLEITPEPSDRERAAIEAALVQEAEEDKVSAWAGGILPQREDELEP